MSLLLLLWTRMQCEALPHSRALEQKGGVGQRICIRHHCMSALTPPAQKHLQCFSIRVLHHTCVPVLRHILLMKTSSNTQEQKCKRMVKILRCRSCSAANIKDTSVASMPNETNAMIHCAPSAFLEGRLVTPVLPRP